MKITILGTFPPYRGGIAHFNELLYNALKQEHEVSVINFSRQYPEILFPGKSQLEDGINVSKQFTNRWMDSINPLSWLKVSRQIRSIAPDLIIYKCWMPFFAPMLGSISKFSRKHNELKSICILDNLIAHEKRIGDKLLSRYLIKNTDGFIVMSQKVRNDLLKFAPTAKYQYNKHPLYTQFGKQVDKETARKKLQIKEKNVILYFGYIRKYKGVQYLIRSVPEILSKIDARIIIAGEFYDDRKKYIKELEKIPQKNKITLVDRFIPDSEVKDFFSAADLMVLPYTNATQSGITQIALNYQLPCVVTNVGGLPEIVHNGETGYVVESENPKSIADAVVKYFHHTDKEKFQENITLEKEKYSWQNFTENLLQLYEKL